MPLVTNENFGDMLLEAAREMVAVQRGELEPAYVERLVLTARHAELRPPHHYAAAEIREIRQRMGVSQRVFAGILNCSPGAVKAWGQELREPDGPTRRLLELADRHPRYCWLPSPPTITSGEMCLPESQSSAGRADGSGR